jgi:hypothetical protein
MKFIEFRFALLIKISYICQINFCEYLQNYIFSKGYDVFLK